jgi:hypothetical protein
MSGLELSRMNEHLISEGLGWMYWRGFVPLSYAPISYS